MSTYLVGNVLGRLLISYAFVWLVIFIVASGFNWREALKHTHKWYGLASIGAVFVLGMAGALSKGGLT